MWSQYKYEKETCIYSKQNSLYTTSNSLLYFTKLQGNTGT